jgi:hypothetical protein
MSSTHTWKRELLTTRIRELNDAKMHAFTVDGMFYGASPSVRELIAKAVWCCENDELEYCEGLCEAAEAAIIRHSQHV